MLAKSAEHPVVMALALAEPGAGAVDRHQGHEDEVGKDVRRVERGLEHRPGPGLDRLAGEEAEWALMVGEGGNAVIAPVAAALANAGRGLISFGSG